MLIFLSIGYSFPSPKLKRELIFTNVDSALLCLLRKKLRHGDHDSRVMATLKKGKNTRQNLGKLETPRKSQNCKKR